MIPTCNNCNYNHVYVHVSLTGIDNIYHIYQNRPPKSISHQYFWHFSFCQDLIVRIMCKYTWNLSMKISVWFCCMVGIHIVWIINISHRTLKTNISLIVLKIPVRGWRMRTVWIYWRNIILSFQINNNIDIRNIQMLNKLKCMVGPFWMSMFYL